MIAEVIERMIVETRNQSYCLILYNNHDFSG